MNDDKFSDEKVTLDTGAMDAEQKPVERPDINPAVTLELLIYGDDITSEMFTHGSLEAFGHAIEERIIRSGTTCRVLCEHSKSAVMIDQLQKQDATIVGLRTQIKKVLSIGELVKTQRRALGDMAKTLSVVCDVLNADPTGGEEKHLALNTMSKLWRRSCIKIDELQEKVSQLSNALASSLKKEAATKADQLAQVEPAPEAMKE